VIANDTAVATAYALEEAQFTSAGPTPDRYPARTPLHAPLKPDKTVHSDWEAKELAASPVSLSGISFPAMAP
jgi:hypothetical protein